MLARGYGYIIAVYSLCGNSALRAFDKIALIALCLLAIGKGFFDKEKSALAL